MNWRTNYILPMAPDPRTTGQVLNGQVIIPGAIDSDRLRRWLAYCENIHRDRCAPRSSHLAASLSLLDCTTPSLESDPQHRRFAALSCVWGSPDDNHTSPSGSFPQVIEDAITV